MRKEDKMNTDLTYEELNELLEDMLETFELKPTFDVNLAVKQILTAD